MKSVTSQPLPCPAGCSQAQLKRWVGRVHITPQARAGGNTRHRTILKAGRRSVISQMRTGRSEELGDRRCLQG